MLQFTLPDNSILQLPNGSNLLTIAKLSLTNKSPIVEGILDGMPIDLQAPLRHGGRVEFLEMDTEEGMRIYLRTLLFVLLATAEKLYPQAKLEVRNTLGSALYIADQSEKPLSYRDWYRLEKAMHEYVDAKEPIKLRLGSKAEALAIAVKNGLPDKIDLLERVAEDAEMPIYSFAGSEGYYFGSLCPDASYVPLFELIPYGGGVILNYPDVGDYKTLPVFEDCPLLQDAFDKTEEWSKLVNCNTIAKLNRLQREGKSDRMIQVAEALQEKNLAKIADMVAMRKDSLKLILIAGPSSSGKTSTAQRLSIQLAVNGLNALPISMDDYYINRVNTPRKANGEYDFECLEAIDVPLFNEHITKLMNGEEVEIPKYNFKKGEREYRGNKLKMQKNSVLIVEGIHGLNEKLTAEIPAQKKLKIYVSALSPMSLDEHSRINTTNVRLLRRIVRDNQFRGHDAVATLNKWADVREGEGKYIFPFQGSADIIFNTTLIYELAVLKRYAEPLLKQVQPKDGMAYTTAQRLLALLFSCDTISEDVIPNNSIIKEFIGGSVFKEAL